MHRVINYCIDDVALERDLAAFVDKFGYVINETGEIVNIVPEWTP